MPGPATDVMMPPLDVMATDSKIAGNGLEPVCNAHQRADNVGDHVQDEHRHGLFQISGVKVRLPT